MSSSDYEIGYGKPPKHSQFKPGQSGNPRGRVPVKDKLAEASQNALFRKITIRTDKGTQRVSMMEAMLMQLSQQAAKGDKAAIRMVLGMSTQYWQRPDPKKQGLEGLTRGVTKILEGLSDDELKAVVQGGSSSKFERSATSDADVDDNP